MDLLCFCSVLCLLCLCARKFTVGLSWAATSEDQKIGFPDKLSLSEGFKYCRML